MKAWRARAAEGRPPLCFSHAGRRGCGLGAVANGLVLVAGRCRLGAARSRVGTGYGGRAHDTIGVQGSLGNDRFRRNDMPEAGELTGKVAWSPEAGKGIGRPFVTTGATRCRGGCDGAQGRGRRQGGLGDRKRGVEGWPWCAMSPTTPLNCNRVQWRLSCLSPGLVTGDFSTIEHLFQFRRRHVADGFEKLGDG